MENHHFLVGLRAEGSQFVVASCKRAASRPGKAFINSKMCWRQRDERIGKSKDPSNNVSL